MDLDKIINEGKSNKYNFFKGRVEEIINTYESDYGTFLLGKNTNDIELLWGVDDLEDLHNFLDKITDEEPELNFVFRYSGELDDVIKKKDIIEEWGYSSKNLYVGYYYHDINDLQIEDDDILFAVRSDLDEILGLEREIFDSLNISKTELEDLIKNDIVLVYKKKNKIKGFVMIEIYGEKDKNCFIRNLGVEKSERGKGIGKKLLLKGLQEAKRRNVVNSMLWVDRENKIARNLYEKVGYNLNKKESEVIFEV